jgi:hypothetical protein
MQELPIPNGLFWFGGLPSTLRYEGNYLHEYRLNMASTHQLVDQIIGIRQAYLYGPRTEFGALGARFTPQKNGLLSIQVVASDDKISNGGAGLSENFALAVFHEVIEMTEQIDALGSGILRFDHALQHPVDSDLAIFRTLARSIMYLWGAATFSPETITAKIQLAREEVSRHIQETAKVRL